MTANDYRELSLRARLAVGLCCFERYCREKRLRHPMIDDFLDRMWELPCTESLPEWEARPCVLVHAGLGDSFPPEFEDLFHRDKLFKREFRELLESTVEIIYCSAYGKGDNAASLRFLERVLRSCSGANVTPPPPQPFSKSSFAEDYGWGKRLSAAERDAWRSDAHNNSAV